ncbi:MAG: 16S rRNA (uracil(1498)-N(3))-methyltransferase [Methylococcales bacterium]|nr:16S rRNA (uracil(1498)-N(3))-methyltransferase [Methylococcales bacterium]
MRVSRLFVDLPLNTGQTLELNEESGHYLRTVLRLKKDAQVILFNGQGGEYTAILLEVSRKRVRVHIDKKIARSVESPLHVSMGMGISRGDRMDMAVQKSVELGVNRINPIITQRCNVVIKADKAEHKRQHWQKIAQQAAEQCGRTQVPDVEPIVSYSSWVERSFDATLKLFLDPFSEQPLTQVKNTPTQVVLLTGPEGGFCEQEKQHAITHGFIPIRLGARILRTETASLAALSAVQLLWGDLGE